MPSPITVTILAIGGGGSGGSDAGGGGGGGGAAYGPAVFDEHSSYNIVVGSGGITPYQSGQASYVIGFPVIAYGGSAGGSVFSGPVPGGGAAGGSYNVTGGSGGSGARGGNSYGGAGQALGPVTGAGGGGGELDGNDGSPVPGGAGGGLAGAGGFGAGWNQRNNTPGYAYGGGGGGGGNYGGQGSSGASGVVTISYSSDIQLFNGGTVSFSSGVWTHTFTTNGQLVPAYTQALPTFGPLSLGAIRGEFGGPEPISFASYYKGGAYVTNYSYAPNVPRSGAIKISEFYGTAQYIPQPRSISLADGQTWSVPTTISGPITLTVIGSAGGYGGNDVSPGYPGYPGHQVGGSLTVNPGDVILASVGGAGVGGGSGSGPGTQGQGGYGGVLGYSGGYGGWAGYAGWSGGGGGGGGATAVTCNGTVIAVAAGGAGGGGGGWHSNGRPSQGYSSTGVPQGGQGQNKDGHDGNDGGGAGGGGGGYWGGNGGATYGGDEGAWSGSDGADLVPPGGYAITTNSGPTVIINAIW